MNEQEAAQLVSALIDGLQPYLIGGLQAFNRIATDLETLTGILQEQAAGDADPDDAPQMERPLESYRDFDWGSIPATVLAEDEFGPTVVSWHGKAFKRRAPDNAYNPAIWYSRCIGKGEDGSNKYVRLITFRPMSDSVEPMGRKAERAVSTARPATPPAARPTAQPSQRDPGAAAAAERAFADLPSASASLPAQPPITARPTGPQVGKNPLAPRPEPPLTTAEQVKAAFTALLNKQPGKAEKPDDQQLRNARAAVLLILPGEQNRERRHTLSQTLLGVGADAWTQAHCLALRAWIDPQPVKVDGATDWVPSERALQMLKVLGLTQTREG